MRTSRSKASRVTRQLRRRGLPFALLAVGMVVLQASECSKEDFYNPFGGISLTGRISGTVTLDDDPAPGTTVTVRQGGSVIDMETTDASGFYTIPGLDPGNYMVSTTITGANCPEQTAVVEEDEETEVDIACTTPEPQTGTLTGTVTVNGVGESGVDVTLRDGTTVIGTTTTGTSGTYTFTNVTAGTRNVSIETPEGATCATTQQDVTVPAGGTATANFACTRPAPGFNITFAMPVPGYCHIGPGDSRTYTGFWTDPAQAGASYSFSWTGPGTVGGTTRTGTLDASGGGFDEQMINQFGTYTGMASVTVGGNTETATTSVTVTGAQGACQQISSIRYKRGVVALLPDDVHPLGLNWVSFRYVTPWGDPSVPRIGLIAEEVAGVYPEAVVLDAEGRAQAIDYGRLTTSVIEEVEARAAEAAKAAIALLANEF
jgi:hypothetical protein